MDDSRISIEEFLKIAHVTKKTVKNNATKIPGLTYKEGMSILVYILTKASEQ